MQYLSLLSSLLISYDQVMQGRGGESVLGRMSEMIEWTQLLPAVLAAVQQFRSAVAAHPAVAVDTPVGFLSLPEHRKLHSDIISLLITFLLSLCSESSDSLVPTPSPSDFASSLSPDFSSFSSSASPSLFSSRRALLALIVRCYDVLEKEQPSSRDRDDALSLFLTRLANRFSSTAAGDRSPSPQSALLADVLNSVASSYAFAASPTDADQQAAPTGDPAALAAEFEQSWAALHAFLLAANTKFGMLTALELAGRPLYMRTGSVFYGWDALWNRALNWPLSRDVTAESPFGSNLALQFIATLCQPYIRSSPGVEQMSSVPSLSPPLWG
jgi:hypothetical protein